MTRNNYLILKKKQNKTNKSRQKIMSTSKINAFSMCFILVVVYVLNLLLAAAFFLFFVVISPEACFKELSREPTF